MMLDHRSDLGHRRRRYIGDEKDHMGITHGDAARRVQVRGVDRTHLQLDPAGVHRLGQGNLGPIQARGAHVDGDQLLALPPPAQATGHGVEHDVVAARRLHQQPGHASCAVAAGADFVPIGVPEANIGLRGRRGFYADDLVAADTGHPVRDGARLRDPRSKGQIPGLNHDKVVAEPVHLEERTAHGAGYRGLRGKGHIGGRKSARAGFDAVAALPAQHGGKE